MEMVLTLLAPTFLVRHAEETDADADEDGAGEGDGDAD